MSDYEHDPELHDEHISRLYKKLPQAQPSAETDAAILAAAQAALKPKARHGGWWLGGLASAASLVLVVGLVRQWQADPAARWQEEIAVTASAPAAAEEQHAEPASAATAPRAEADPRLAAEPVPPQRSAQAKPAARAEAAPAAMLADSAAPALAEDSALAKATTQGEKRREALAQSDTLLARAKARMAAPAPAPAPAPAEMVADAASPAEEAVERSQAQKQQEPLARRDGEARQARTAESAKRETRFSLVAPSLPTAALAAAPRQEAPPAAATAQAPHYRALIQQGHYAQALAALEEPASNINADAWTVLDHDLLRLLNGQEGQPTCSSTAGPALAQQACQLLGQYRQAGHITQAALDSFAAAQARQDPTRDYWTRALRQLRQSSEKQAP